MSVRSVLCLMAKIFLERSSTVNGLNPYLTPIIINWMSPPSFLGVLNRSDFEFLSHFSMKILLANRIAPDETPSSAILFAYVLTRTGRHAYMS